MLRRYIKASLRADAAIKADMPKAVEVLDAGKYYRVDKATLTAALPRQMPQVDITKGGDKGMEIAVADMVTLGYLKTAAKIIDTTHAEAGAWLTMAPTGRSKPARGRRAAAGECASCRGSRPSLKGVAPWVVLIAVWEWAAAAGWSGAVLFPPPSVVHRATRSRATSASASATRR